MTKLSLRRRSVLAAPALILPQRAKAWTHGTTGASPPPAPLPFVLGKVPFASSSSWNTPVPSGAVYWDVAWPATTGFNYSVSWDAYSPAVYVSSPSDPVVHVPIPNTWGYPAQTIQVHLVSGATGAPGADGEILIIDGTSVLNFWMFA